jgi:hypothetical protein
MPSAFRSVILRSNTRETHSRFGIKGKESEMSFTLSDIKWGRVVVGILVALLISIVGLLVAQTVAITVRGFQLRGTPPREEQVAILLGTPLRIVGILLTALGGFVGGRMAGRRAEAGQQLNGLTVGVLTAVLRLAWDLYSLGFSFWTVIHVVLAAVGGWLGGWLASRSAEPGF